MKIAYQKGIMEDDTITLKDLFDTKIMGILTPAPSVVQRTFADKYDNQTIKKWLTTCTRRFFNMQFKRSCLPDGPKVGSVGLSPRGDWRMASDACSTIWMEELEELE